ncbi:cytochrome P450 [Phlegmacium glaucopus]|nr:cytochrome P450 [Phlegmacium glaucopus]
MFKYASEVGAYVYTRWGIPIPSSWIAVLLVLTIATCTLQFLSSKHRYDNDGVLRLQSLPYIDAWYFLTKPYDFLQHNLRKTGKRMFSFNIRQHHVVVLTGAESRKIFHTDKSLSLGQANLILRGVVPQIQDVGIKYDELAGEPETEFIKRLHVLQHRDRLVDLIPILLDDLNRVMKDWGNQATINPFDQMYKLVFQMTMRMATCRELSDDPDAVKALAQHYRDHRNGSTPTAALFPWFPSWAKVTKLKATTALFNMLSSHVELRRKSTVQTNDPFDILIARGDTNTNVAGFIAIMIAGAVNTGTSSSWALLHLAVNAVWKAKAINELKTLVTNHSNAISSEPIHKQLASIPLTAWEEETPVLDAVIRETLRLFMTGSSLRRVVYDDVTFGDITIKRGDFLACSHADVHLDPDIYTDPLVFDPARYGPGREEDKKVAFGYISWGAGRHICAGMRVAKLEIKLLLAVVLLRYKYTLVDGSGHSPTALPKANKNSHDPDVQILGEPCYLKLERLNA